MATLNFSYVCIGSVKHLWKTLTDNFKAYKMNRLMWVGLAFWKTSFLLRKSILKVKYMLGL